MRQFRFQVLETKDASPQEWLRVWSARYRLLNSQKLPGTVSSYLHSFLPFFKELADGCGCDTMDDLRVLDKALFSYDALESRIF
jgi:hypothetical protein